MRRLWNALSSRLANMKMKRKVILTYVILSILPISCLNIFTYQYTKQLLLEREGRLAADSISQAALQVDYQLQLYNSLSDYIFNDAKILDAVNASYGEQYYKMNKTYADTIAPAFQTYYFLHPELRRLIIYTGSDLHPYGGYIHPLSLLEQEAWYPLIAGRYQPAWLVTERDGQPILLSVRQMSRRRAGDYFNYLCLELDYHSFFSPLSAVTSDVYGVAVLGEEGNVLYAYSSLPSSPDPAAFASSASLEGLEREYLVAGAAINEGRWRVYYYRPQRMVTASVTGVIRTLFLILWVVLLLLGILAWVFSGVIVSPLELLTRNMRQVRSGDMQATVHSRRKDEIGILIQSFSDMIDRINRLIEVGYKHEIEKREYQLSILRAQINPHFLYNSLSLINSRAIVAGQEEISKMALLISSFYRTALNHGQDTTTVENELANTRSYTSIQLLLSADSFSVEYETDPTVTACEIPHFILQPIVENAMVHGLLDSPSPHRLLRVSAGWQKDFIRLQVEDNGVGMSPERVAGLLHSRSSGYGLRNVNERLLLLYGENYRFLIDSREGAGTSVTLLLAKVLPRSRPAERAGPAPLEDEA